MRQNCAELARSSSWPLFPGLLEQPRSLWLGFSLLVKHKRATTSELDKYKSGRLGLFATRNSLLNLNLSLGQLNGLFGAKLNQS